MMVSRMLNHRYSVVAKIGEGGSSTVYRAEDRKHNNALRAIKEICLHNVDPQEGEQIVRMFSREAMLLLGISHPNVPRVRDFFHEGGCLYLAMDFIEGQTLEDAIAKAPSGKLPLGEVLNIGIQLCSVLHYLHSQQPPIIFRDLKPSNVMRTSAGHVYVIDFGIARSFKPGRKKDTNALGTVGYAAPEQYGRGQTLPQTDIYSLGATLHHLLSGRDPSENPFQFPFLNLTKDAPAGPRVASLIEQMVAMDARKRPGNADLLGLEFQRLTQDISSGGGYRITILPETANAAFTRALDLYNRRSYQQALDAFERALELDPKFKQAYFYKASTLHSLRRYQAALTYYDQALKIDPNYVEAYVNKGITLADLGRYQEAINCYDQAIWLHGSYKLAHDSRNKALAALKRP